MNLLQVLINTLQDKLICRTLWLRGKLNYPLHILPKTGYIPQINIDQLYKTIPLVVVRRSDEPKEKIFDKFGHIREDAIKTSDIPNMSMNLLGGSFKYDYIQFNPTSESAKLWNGNEKVFYSKYRKFVKLHFLTTPIFFEVTNLHNITFPYQRSNKDKEFIKLMNSLNIEQIESNGKFKVNGKGYISHVPTLLNYWHVEFQIRDIANKIIKKDDSVWRKEAADSARQCICQYASAECPNISDIPKSYFYK